MPGVCAGVVDKFLMGAAFGKALTLETRQTHVRKHAPTLLKHIADGGDDPSVYGRAAARAALPIASRTRSISAAASARLG